MSHSTPYHACLVQIGPWLSGINQTWYMPLLFFVSALYTPASLEKRGVRGFLQNKTLRLGVPVILWVALMGPLYYQVQSTV